MPMEQMDWWTHGKALHGDAETHLKRESDRKRKEKEKEVEVEWVKTIWKRKLKKKRKRRKEEMVDKKGMYHLKKKQI